MELHMTRKEKLRSCNDFLNRLAYLLGYHYELLPSCNHDESRYLVPAGSKSEISYYGKPDRSFRMSDHWNWFSSEKKCPEPDMIQCRSLDMPWTRKREQPGKATQPRYGVQVCIYDAKTKCYHHIHGDKFDRKTREWTWVEGDPVLVAAQIIGDEVLYNRVPHLI